MKEREKTWNQKVKLVRDSFKRTSEKPGFGMVFYKKLFWLHPPIENYFKETDFKEQEKALLNGVHFLIGYLSKDDENAKTQVIRIAKTHSHKNLNIHPHDYYYWTEAIILTIKEFDRDWHDDLEYYWREVISYPVSFIVSQYFRYG